MGDIYQLLGELLHLCQRIEWTMKYMVEQAHREVVIKSLDEPVQLESKWQDNKDCLGGVVHAYLDLYYDMPKDDVEDDPEHVKIWWNYRFIDIDNPTTAKEEYDKREAEFKELINVRNFLAHRFGLKYHLQDEANCKEAMDYLQEARDIIIKHAKIIDAEHARLNYMMQMQLSSVSLNAIFTDFERQRRIRDLTGKVGTLKSNDYSNIGYKSIFDYTDNQDVIDAIMYGKSGNTPEYFAQLPKETQLAHLQELAYMSEDKKFIKAVKKWQKKLGIG